MKYWRVIIVMIIMVTIVFLAGCRQDDPEEMANGGDQIPDESETLQLSEVLVELSVWQSREHGAEEIVSYREEDLRRSIKLGIHEQDIIFRMSFAEDKQVDITELESIVTLTGGTFRITEGSASHIYDVHLRDVRDQAELVLGDLPTFEFIRHESHLSFALNQSSLQSPYSLVIHSEEDGHSHIFVSDQEESVVIRFSAPMVRLDKPGTEWLSDTQLRINIQETDGIVDLSDVYSTEGNFLERKHPHVKVHPTPARSWFNAASGGNVGWSARDAYYDALLFAQNSQRYAGLVKLSEDEDGAGETYGIVIEQRSQNPTVLEHTIHVRQEAGTYPIEWRHGGKLMYMSGFQLWEYDINSGKSQKVVSSDDDIQQIAFQYDHKNQRLYILSQQRQMQNGQEYMAGVLDIYTYQDSEEPVWTERQEAISDLWAAEENGVLPLEMAMSGDGYYVTTYREGSIVTYYTVNGEATDPVRGSLIGITERGAYLKVAGDDGKPAALTWWPLDGEPVALTPFSEAASYIMFGGDLFAHRAGGANSYYGYNMSADGWVEWSPNDGLDSWIPNQKTAYYRVEV